MIMIAQISINVADYGYNCERNSNYHIVDIAKNRITGILNLTKCSECILSEVNSSFLEKHVDIDLVDLVSLGTDHLGAMVCQPMI